MGKALLLVTVICQTGVRAPAQAEDAGPLSAEDVLDTRELGQLMPIEFSPDGQLLAYTVQNTLYAKPFDQEKWARTGVPPWAAGTDIWISTIAGAHRNLTCGKGDNWYPSWSPDNHYLAFFSTRDGSGQARLWIWDAIKDDLRKVSDANIRGDQIEWTLNSREILVPTLPEDLSVDDYVSTRLYGRVRRNPLNVKRSESTVVLYNPGAPATNAEQPESDAWNLDENLRDLALVHIATGKTRLIVRGQRVAKYLLSPDGSRLAYTSPQKFEKPGSQQILFDIFTVTLKTGETHLLAAGVRLGYDGAQFSWSSNNSQLAYRAAGMEQTTDDIYVIDLTSGEQRNTTKLPKPLRRNGSHGTFLWSRTGSDIYFIRDGSLWRTSPREANPVELAEIPERRIERIISASDGLLWLAPGTDSAVVVTHDDVAKQDGFYQIDLRNLQTKRLIERNECYTCVNVREQISAVSKDGHELAYFAQDTQHGNDIWITDPTFKRAHRLTDLNPQFEQRVLGKSRLISWLSDDGELLHGALLLPARFKEGKRYPLVVYVYGGISLSDDIDRFGGVSQGAFNMQLLSGRGFAVLLPDAPQHIGTPMLDLVKTVLPGVNKVIEMGIADSNRLGVIGHSFGGYSTLALLVQTPRFKAAVDVDGFGDLVGAYGEADNSGAAFASAVMERGQGLMGGTPWQYRERYIENSPAFYLDRVETPLLLVHGTLDSDVAPFLGDQIFVGLRRLRKEVEYAKYIGEEHSPIYWSHANQLDFCKRWIDWFTRYLRP